MQIGIEEIGKSYPVVCIVVENHDGEFLNKDYKWEKIPAHQALIFPARLDKVKKELKKLSIDHFYANWALNFGGIFSLESKTLVTSRKISQEFKQ